MAIKRYTESQNIRFEVHIVELIDEALKSDWCKSQGFNRSDLIRHLVRVGLTNFSRSQPKNRQFINELDRDTSSVGNTEYSEKEYKNLFE
jgi:hypothetical protein